MLEAAAACRVTCGAPEHRTPCTDCKIRTWAAPQKGQFGHHSFNKPWELTHDRVRIVQVGWCIYDAEGNKLRGAVFCIRDVPGGCSARATQRHGLTNDELTARGTSIDNALRVLDGALHEVERNGGTLTAYNLEFDTGILHAELVRLGDAWRARKARLARMAMKGCCTHQWTKHANNLPFDARTNLDMACEPFDINTKHVDAQGRLRRHTSNYDAHLAGQLYFGLLKTHTSTDKQGWTSLQIPLSMPIEDPADQIAHAALRGM